MQGILQTGDHFQFKCSFALNRRSCGATVYAVVLTRAIYIQLDAMRRVCYRLWKAEPFGRAPVFLRAPLDFPSMLAIATAAHGCGNWPHSLRKSRSSSAGAALPLAGNCLCLRVSVCPFFFFPQPSAPPSSSSSLQPPPARISGSPHSLVPYHLISSSPPQAHSPIAAGLLHGAGSLTPFFPRA